MITHASPWLSHALQRIASQPAQPLVPPERMEWTTRPGQGPGAEVLGPDLRGRRLLELGCGPGHNIAHLAFHRRAQATGVDLIGLQIRRARSHYRHLAGARFAAGHALHYLHATEHRYDAIYSVFGAIGLVAPELLLPAIAERLKPGAVLAFSVPHPRRAGRTPPADGRPRRDFLTLPDRTRLPLVRWEFDTPQWQARLADAGLALVTAQDLGRSAHRSWPTTLLITAHKV